MPERGRGGGAGWLATFGPQRIIVAVAGLVIVAVAGLLLFAWYDEFVRPRREPALEVGDRSYSMEYFAKRYRQAIEDPANTAALRDGLLSSVPEQVLTEMESEAILLQRADTLGIGAGQNEIDREMLLRINVPVVTDTPEGSEVGPDDSFTVTPLMEQAVRAQLQRFDYTLAQYRAIAHAQLLRDKAGTYFRDQTPARAPQVRVRLLQFPNESDSRIAIQKITSGEATFEELAETVSLDRAGKGKGGARDWLTRGILPPKVDDVAFSLPLNTLSEPIDAGEENAWIVLEVLERTDERDVTDTVRRQLANQALSTWLNEQKEMLGVKRALTEAKIRWAYDWANPTIPQSILNNQGTPPGSVPGTLPSNPVPSAPGAVPGASPAGSPASSAP